MIIFCDSKDKDSFFIPNIFAIFLKNLTFFYVFTPNF
jgi:hypothetical protein